MRLARTTLIALCIAGAAAPVHVGAQATGQGAAAPYTSFRRLTAQELNLLVADAAQANPMAIKRLAEDPQAKRDQIESLRELLALASEAQNLGLASDSPNDKELENIKKETIAVNYDRHINKVQLGASMVPFRSITEGAIAEYWGEQPGSSLAPAVKAARKAAFDEFLSTKLSLLKPSGRASVTEAEKAHARELFTKIEIYADEYAKRSARLPLSFRQKVSLQVKLQQAQFLSRLYREKVVAEISASDAEVASFMEGHPTYDTTAKREKAEKILARAKAGEDFAKLANEFTEDPGNKGAGDQQQGGQYRDVKRGVMVAPFENAALALEPGQIAPTLVESDFGFHIIKLNRKDASPTGTYDVSHILIGTTLSDPSNPTGRPLPAKEYARRALEQEKEQMLIERLIEENDISVPDDFVVPSARALTTAAEALSKPKPRRPVRKKRP